MSKTEAGSLGDRITRAVNDGREGTFEAWLEQPHVRFMIRLIPPPENPDTLMDLLRTAFEQGYGAGTVTTAAAMVGELTRDLRK